MKRSSPGFNLVVRCSVIVATAMQYFCVARICGESVNAIRAFAISRNSIRAEAFSAVLHELFLPAAPSEQRTCMAVVYQETVAKAGSQ